MSRTDKFPGAMIEIVIHWKADPANAEDDLKAIVEAIERIGSTPKTIRASIGLISAQSGNIFVDGHPNR